MNKMIIILTLPLLALTLNQCVNNKEAKVEKVKTSNIPAATIDKAIKDLKAKFPDFQANYIESGITQTASLWRSEDGTPDDFIDFCVNNFAGNDSLKNELFEKLSFYFETIFGNLNKLNIELKSVLHVDKGEVSSVDEMFGSYNSFAHINDDFFNNKIAHLTILNFPFYNLNKKNELGKDWSSLEWAYARMGDVFTSRVPASLLLNSSEIITAADNYISQYNIYMGNLLNDEGKTLFPEDLKLISHWGLRDELKANYNAENGLEKQKMIYQVMNRIIAQDIPKEVINDNKYKWNPFANKVFENNNEISFTKEPDVRYNHLLNVFKSQKAMDKYYPAYSNYIERTFEQDMEISVDEVEHLFVDFISSDEVKQVAQLISKRLQRQLQPFDIWYDGFKDRSFANQDELDKIVNAKYGDISSFEKDLPAILMKLGFEKNKANFIASKIKVDASRGAGHAWGALMKSESARLRTRLGKNGMDYKGYNIAAHEFGHNVEQTITLHDVDYYMLNGVPNTAFTEALAFIFQKRDLQLLGIKNNNPNSEYYSTLDVFWGAYEIMGVALVDINVWKWMYKNPEATSTELKNAVLKISQEIWNNYYADVLGGYKDQNILAIYSHMIDAPLYLANYPLGHIIEFQIENQIKDKSFSEEICRIYSKGKLTPKIWMQNAVGNKISTEPLLNEVKNSINKIN